ncbi:MAG: DNA-directed RNA polymerase [Euryarchaeota archaeon]|nr:DNA-directed RNA polymerase [Euryarchaeota archaeon]
MEENKVICSKCGVETTVPFVPTEGRDVYCRGCLRKIRDERRRF